MADSQVKIKATSCEHCAYSAIKGAVGGGQPVCRRLHIPIDPEQDGCTFGASETAIASCSICHRPVPMPTIVILEDHRAIGVCAQCQELLNTCQMCKHSENCAFETDPSTLPKQVQKQIPIQGGYAMTYVRNPERIAITCEKGCKCYNAELQTCNREFGMCGNHDIFL